MEEPVLEVTDEARNVVASWLGISVTSDDEDDDGEDTNADLEKQRAPRLGLGAKFIPHKQVAKGPADKIAAAVKKGFERDQRLKNQDQAGSRDWRYQNISEEEEPSEEEEEDAGRGSIGGVSRVRAKANAFAQSTKRPAESEPVKKKKKKKKAKY